MTQRLLFSPEAQKDLTDLYLVIAGRAGRARAIGYIDRIEARCFSLTDFPERGMRRDDLWPGLRVMGFERRTSIAFVVGDDTVTILRVLYGGRDLETAFADDVP